MKKWNKKDFRWQRKKDKEKKKAQSQTELNLSTENMLRERVVDQVRRTCNLDRQQERFANLYLDSIFTTNAYRVLDSMPAPEYTPVGDMSILLTDRFRSSLLTNSFLQTIKNGLKRDATPQQIEDAQRLFNLCSDVDKSIVTIFVKTASEESRIKLLFPGIKVLQSRSSPQPGVTPQTSITQTQASANAVRRGLTNNTVRELEVTTEVNSPFFVTTTTAYLFPTLLRTHPMQRADVNQSYFTWEGDTRYYNWTDPSSGGTRSMSVRSSSDLLPNETPANLSRRSFDLMFGNSTNVATYREREELPDWTTGRINGAELVNAMYAQLNDAPMSLQEYQGNNVVRPDYRRESVLLPPSITTNPCELISEGLYSPFNTVREEVQDTEEECVLCGCELKGVVLKCTQCNNRVHWGGMERYKVMKCPFCRLEFREDID